MKKLSKISKKIGSFFMSSTTKYTFFILFILILSYLLQYFINKPNLGVFLSSDMDPAGNIYVLGVDTNSDQFKVTKFSSDGTALFKIDLEKSNNEYSYAYGNLEVDTKGNFYIVRTQRNIKAVASDKSMYPIFMEKVLMYAPNGAFVKEVANMDFSKQGNPPIENYIQKIQLVGQSMTIICRKNNLYDIISADPLSDDTPEKINSFEISPPTTVADQELKWVSDMSVLSTGRVFYSTKNGELWGMDNLGSFVDYSSAVSPAQFLVTGMNVDSKDNIYFTDILSGNYCKLDTKSVISKNVYNLESKLVGDGSVQLKDVRKIKLIDDEDFYAPSKSFDKPFYIRFGRENTFTTDIRGSFWPWGLFMMLGICIAIILIIYIAGYIGRIGFKHVPIAIKIVLLFLPVCVIAMGALVYVNTSDAVTEYISILRSEQERGAKTVVESINGSDFADLDHVSDYMSANYVKFRRSIEDGYDDLALKVGDRSDYIITYIEKYGKLYSTISTRYNVNSVSYDELKYTDPDMVSSQCSLVDTILERDESETLYKIWNQFSDKSNTNYSLDAKFRDVHGDMNATFIAVKDKNGKVVGFVGNFLDASVHTSAEFWRIFKHSLAIILTVTVLIFVYLCFAVKFSLRPLKKIKKGLETVHEGKWDTRIKVSSEDEFADIAQAFNLMSDKIERYTSNLIRLNKEYIRYVPTELFKLMDKEKITQVDVQDNSIVNINMIYITFNLYYRDSYDFEDAKSVFEALNNTFVEIFKVVGDNNGVVQSFSSRDMLLLFPDNVEDAFNASVQLKEVDVHPIIRNRMMITLGSGEVLVGVSGNEERRGVILASDKAMQLYNIDVKLSDVGVSHIATKDIINDIEDDSLRNYRFIGRIGNVDGDGYTEIFEIIDASNEYRKNLYISTKNMFEKGVGFYVSGDLQKARRAFADVLRINEQDDVAVYYMAKCDENISKFERNELNKNTFRGYIV